MQEQTNPINASGDLRTVQQLFMKNITEQEFIYKLFEFLKIQNIIHSRGGTQQPDLPLYVIQKALLLPETI